MMMMMTTTMMMMMMLNDEDNEADNKYKNDGSDEKDLFVKI